MFNYSDIGKLAGIISFIGFIPYIYEIIKGKVKPSGITWLVWTVIGISSYISYVSMHGSEHTIWVPISYALGPFIILIFCMKYGDKTYSRLDISCFISSIISFSLSSVFDNFNINLLTNIFADLLAAVPTIRKTYLNAELEDFKAWMLFLIGNFLNLLVIDSGFQIKILYPLYLFVVSAVMVLLILRGKIK